MNLNRIYLVIALIAINFCTIANVNVMKTMVLVDDSVANDPIKISQALAQIVSNNSGEDIRQVLASPFVQEALVKSGIRRSYFEKIDHKFLPKNSHEKYWFHVVLQEEFVKNLIQQAGFSYLPKNRKKIILWSVKQQFNEELGQDEASYADTDEVAMYWFKHWADVLAFDLMFPKYDEQDKKTVTVNSIKNLSYEASEYSKKQYGVNQSLSVFINTDDIETSVRSALFINEEMFTNSEKQLNSNESEVLYSIFSDAAQNYAQIYKIDSSEKEVHTIQIVIKEIDSYNQINRIKNYLDGLSVIDSSYIVSATRGELILTLSLNISTKAFVQIIHRDNVLLHLANESINQSVFRPVK